MMVDDVLKTDVSVAYNAGLRVIDGVDPKIGAAIRQELADQRGSLKLIASENYASPATLLTMGNWLSDKYAEGSVGKRFYAACENVDTVESLAAAYACELFGAEHAYVQAHSGIDANLVAFWAILSKRVELPALERLGLRQVNEMADADWAELRQALGNQRLLGMSLDAGGHLTHGFRPNISGKMFEQASYGVDPVTGLVDYDEVRRIAVEFKPLIIVAGYSAYPRLLDFERFRAIADEVGATLMVDMAHFAGLVAGKVLTGVYNPVGYADIVTSTTHKSLRGPRGGLVLCTEAYAPFVERGCPMVLGGPLPQVMAAKAVAFVEALRPDFAVYAQAIVDNARALAAGLTAAGGRVLTGGTDNHLLVLDVTGYGLTGRQAESALLDAGIVVNRNAIPGDAHGAWYTSGIRLGTPALTTRGFTVEDMAQVAVWIDEVLRHTRPVGESLAKYDLDPVVRDRVVDAIASLLTLRPLYGDVVLG